MRRPMLYPAELRARRHLRYTASVLADAVKVMSKFHGPRDVGRHPDLRRLRPLPGKPLDRLKEVLWS